MSQVKGVGGQISDPLQNINPGDPAANRQPNLNDPNSTLRPVGPPGEMGQPIGLPLPGTPEQAKFLPDVLTGRDPSQLTAAEMLRDHGGVSATDRLLGLDRHPTILGAFSAPPGNSEALRHMTPTMRRTAMRLLLSKQREKMRRLALFLQDEQPDGEEQNYSQQQEEELAEYAFGITKQQHSRATAELKRAAGMIDLLEELLALQDYTLSQMGTFSKG